MFSFCSIHVASPLVRGHLPGDSVGGAGSGACGSGLITRTPRGASGLRLTGTTTLAQGALLYDRANEQVARHASAARACGARLHGNHRGEAPQGAPARVKGRQSLPLKGQAPPQGGHGCGVPHQRFAALHPPRAFEAARTDGGREPSISRSADACLPGCLKSESHKPTTRVVSCAGLTRASMGWCADKQSHDLHLMHSLMDRRVKPGDDSGMRGCIEGTRADRR
jgi:hypothetical protein